MIFGEVVSVIIINNNYTIILISSGLFEGHRICRIPCSLNVKQMNPILKSPSSFLGHRIYVSHNPGLKHLCKEVNIPEMCFPCQPYFRLLSSLRVFLQYVWLWLSQDHYLPRSESEPYQRGKTDRKCGGGPLEGYRFPYQKRTLLPSPLLVELKRIFSRHAGYILRHYPRC